MKIICTHENLKKGLAIVSRVSGSSTTLPVLNNILLKTDQGVLKLSSTNLEIGVNTWVRCKVEEEGGVSVPAKIFTDLINNLPSNEKINLILEQNQLVIEAGNYKTKIKGLGVDEFPLIPQIDEQNVLEIPEKDLHTAISQVAFAAAYSETQPEISGILFSLEGKTLKLVATDRYRLAEKVIDLGREVAAKSLIVPNKAVSELGKILTGAAGEVVKLFVSQNQIMFKTEDTEIISRLIDGQYPDYKQIIPQQFNTDIDASAQDLTTAMRTAGIFTHTGNNVTLEYGEPDQLLITSSSGELGESKVNVPAKVSGSKGKIIFNHRYILDCLATISAKNVTFKLINDNSPVVIQSKEMPGYVYLVMPIKI
jgi:DNA polymerase-3 subunit beta